MHNDIFWQLGGMVHMVVLKELHFFPMLLLLLLVSCIGMVTAHQFLSIHLTRFPYHGGTKDWGSSVKWVPHVHRGC